MALMPPSCLKSDHHPKSTDTFAKDHSKIFPSPEYCAVIVVNLIEYGSVWAISKQLSLVNAASKRCRVLFWIYLLTTVKGEAKNTHALLFMNG